MDKICPKCNVEFKDDDQVEFDLSHEVTHSECFDGNPGLVLASGIYKEIAEQFDKVTR
ncbi:hypothetical protein [Niallia endozanthoxylica]|uniref:hypothetical protein n=1 Tax=Niallia endozanthoxylica TaxID=2036016 RepID=UPI00168AD2A8|nr:hypothetical protein [Niallia endozanthoxylica]